MGLDKALKIFGFLKYFTPLISVTYLVGWLVQIIDPVFFKILNKFLGLIMLPKVFDHFITSKSTFGEVEVSMGYVYTAIFFIILTSLFNKTHEKLKQLFEDKQDKEERRKAIVESEIKRIKEKEKIKQIEHREMFFGLFEFHLEYLNPNDGNSKVLDRLKLEYSKILVNKLKTKYQKINFLVRDKVFFYSEDFKNLSLVTADILKIFEIFVKTGKSNDIITNMSFSYWAENKNANKMDIFRILCNINKLDNKNKIIISNEIYIKIKSMEKEPWCYVTPANTFEMYNTEYQEVIKADLLEITGFKSNL